MADLKISQLSGASSPLTGTESLPIVQSGTTKKATVSQLDSIRPAFSAYQSVIQSVAALADTVIQFQVEEYDTNNCFASSRFTPTVAGYYIFTGGLRVTTAGCAIYLSFMKNGSVLKRVSDLNPTTTQSYGSAMFYMNGTTDYVEMGVYMTIANDLANDAASTYFQGVMLRAA